MKITIMSPDEIKDIVRATVDEALTEMQKWLPIGEEYLTINETAELLKVSRGTIHNYVSSGFLTKYSINDKPLFKKSEVIDALKEMEVKKQR